MPGGSPPLEFTLRSGPAGTRSALAALLTLLGCGQGDTAPAAAADSRELRIVAHEDDDLLFMNPDLAESIAAGRSVRTVFVTAGDAGKGADYWNAREAGILQAYAEMAAADNAWETETLSIDGRPLQLRTLGADARISVVFLRLPDGGGVGRGFVANDFESLAKLWSGRSESISPVDGSATFSKRELIKLLGGLMAAFHAHTVDTQDWTGHFRGDHSDHLTAALFAHAAERKYRALHTARVYRGYNLMLEAPNLLDAQQRTKERVFLSYAGHDPKLCAPGATCKARSDYLAFLGRQYPYLPGNLIGPGGKCLQAMNEGSPQSRAVVRTCRDLPAQKWSMAGTELRSQRGNCLGLEDLGEGSPPALRVQPCSGTSGQSWAAGSDGRLRSNGLCATVASGGAGSGPEIFATSCGNVPEQKWRLYEP